VTLSASWVASEVFHRSNRAATSCWVIGVQVIVEGVCAPADPQMPMVAITQASVLNLVTDRPFKLSVSHSAHPLTVSCRGQEVQNARINRIARHAPFPRAL